METMLAENIRRFRKERALTQEQLAEVLGVTTGAVYKWEAKLSVPELDLIVEMADFFDISVDVLLGYRMKDNRLTETVRRLREYRREKDSTGLTEAEKALKKYPHSFQIVYESALIYSVFGFESGDRDLLRRALALLEACHPLLPQNEDPEISEQTLYGKMADAYFGLNELEKGIGLLKKHNAGGLYNSKLGHILAMSERTEEAVPYLSEAMAMIVSDLIGTIIGYLNVCLTRGDRDSAEAILCLGIGFFQGLREGGRPNYLDKVSSVLLAALAYTQFLEGRKDEARGSLKKAEELAAFFDASPSYDESDIRFIDRIEGASAHDDIGATAADAVEHAVGEFENEEFAALWKSVKEREDNNG